MIAGPGFVNYAVYSRDFWLPTTKTMFKLHQNLYYRSNDNVRFMVPRGYRTDLGSIPAVFWPFIPRDSYPSAFILHDFLCDNDWISRKAGDMILKEALLHSGAGEFAAWVIYLAVRMYATVAGIK